VRGGGTAPSMFVMTVDKPPLQKVLICGILRLSPHIGKLVVCNCGPEKLQEMGASRTFCHRFGLDIVIADSKSQSATPEASSMVEAYKGRWASTTLDETN
jgi:hypothetical protein